jgi:hypothetical protein
MHRRGRANIPNGPNRNHPNVKGAKLLRQNVGREVTSYSGETGPDASIRRDSGPQCDTDITTSIWCAHRLCLQSGARRQPGAQRRVALSASS